MRDDDGARILVGIGAGVMALWVLAEAAEGYHTGESVHRLILPTIVGLALPILVL